MPFTHALVFPKPTMPGLLLRSRCLHTLLVALALLPPAAAAATPEFTGTTYSNHARPEWQWSAPVPGIVSGETQGSPRAFLWIPPDCRRVRAVVIGQHNMQEEQIFEHPHFRQTLAELDFAVIWVTPPFDLFFRFDKGAAQALDGLLQALAETSGYSELTRVPLVPLGHSAAASYPWNLGALSPERTLAAVSVSGQWPYYKDGNTPDWGDRTVDGVPGLVTMGEFENGFERAGVGLQQRVEHPQLPLSMLAEPAGEHFAASDQKIAYIGLYLQAVAQHRLPAQWPLEESPTLKPVDPTREGWLADRARPDGRPQAPAAPVGSYTGAPADAFWYFNEELAKAAEQLAQQYAGRKLQQLAYVQDGVPVAQIKRHVRVPLKFLPAGDDLTFRLSATLLDTAPADWRGLKLGEPLTHAADLSTLRITRICGPGDWIDGDRWTLRYSRTGMDNPKRSHAICFIASHPGDELHRPISLEAEMKVPAKNSAGAPQTLTFSLPDSIKSGTRSLPLKAISSAGLPVQFYVREGPAVVTDGELRFTRVPPRAKFPIKVTVVAWQWGRSMPPQVQTAEPVERTVLLQP